MSEVLAAGKPDFFGKDSFTPFIGEVEDVNDPTHSGRVKVRCFGWHPQGSKSDGDDSLKTDDLPWARVGMPVTHAQSSRIGGKHGLLPGSYVMGFFLDGDDAQDPFVLCSFNMTSKTSDQDNRKQVETKEGKVGSEYEGYDKIMSSSETVKGNASLHTTQEQGQPGFSDENDSAGDNVNNDSDSNCGGKAALESSQSKASKEEYTKENPVGQWYKVLIADGRCGTNQNGAEDVQNKMQEMFPSQYNRFNYGDVVWEKFQGNYINLQGIIAQISLDICAILKAIIEAIKAQKEEETYRTTHSTIPNAIPDRDGDTRIETTKTNKQKSDMFHALVAMILDKLCSLINNELQNRNNGDQGDDNTDNSDGGGGGGADPTTTINDPGAPCLAAQIITNVLIEVEKGMDDAIVEVDRRFDSDDEDSQSGMDMNSISSILGAISMLFSLTEKYTQRSDVHNSQGDASQDKATRDGCKQERYYNTEEGASMAAGLSAALSAAGSLAAAAGGGGGGTGETTGDGIQITRGSSANNTKDNRLKGYSQLKYGGLKAELISDEYDDTNCEDSTIPKRHVNPNEIGDIWIEGPCNVYNDKKYRFYVKNNGTQEIKDSHFVILKRFGPAGEDAEYASTYGKVKNYKKKNEALITFERGVRGEDKNIYLVYAYVWAPKNTIKGTYYRKKAKMKVSVFEKGINIERLPCPPDLDTDPKDPKIKVPNIEIPDRPEDDDGPEIILPTTPGVITIEDPDNPGFPPPNAPGYIPPNEPPPSGYGVVIQPIPLPSDDPVCAKNYVDGTPNTAIVINSGINYYYKNPLDKDRAFPSVYIPGYIGTPTPVVDRDSGELVAILTNCDAWDPNYPLVPVTVIPDERTDGFTTDDPNIDTFVSGFFIQNTGFQYCQPNIRLFDRDKGEYSDAEVTPVLLNGRIVDVQIEQVGGGFKRLPRVDIFDNGDPCNTRGGFGAKIYPIMGVIAKTQAYADRLVTVQSIYCPSKDLANRFVLRRSTNEMIGDIIRSTNAATYVEQVVVDTTLETAVTVTSTDSSTTITPSPVPVPTPYVTPSPVSTPAPTTSTPATPTPAPTPAPTSTPPSPTPYYGGGGGY